jgi:hypothetical protein
VTRVEEALRATNASLIAFDLALGTGTLLAPARTLRVLGHDHPSEDAEHLFRRCAPIWLTFAAAHTVAARRGEPRDWHALAWLRGTELLTDILWSASPAFNRPGAKAGLWMAGVFNAAVSVGFAEMARKKRRRGPLAAILSRR